MQLHIQNMTCGGCVRSVTKAIQSLDPAARVEADPAAHTVVISSERSQSEIEAALAQAGYPAVQAA